MLGVCSQAQSPAPGIAAQPLPPAVPEFPLCDTCLLGQAELGPCSDIVFFWIVCNCRVPSTAGDKRDKSPHLSGCKWQHVSEGGRRHSRHQTAAGGVGLHFHSLHEQKMSWGTQSTACFGSPVFGGPCCFVMMEGNCAIGCFLQMCTMSCSQEYVYILLAGWLSLS